MLELGVDVGGRGLEKGGSGSSLLLVSFSFLLVLLVHPSSVSDVSFLLVVDPERLSFSLDRSGRPTLNLSIIRNHRLLVFAHQILITTQISIRSTLSRSYIVLFVMDS